MRYRFSPFKSTLYDKGIVTDGQILALTDALSSYSLREIEAYQYMDDDLTEALDVLRRALGEKAKAVLHHLFTNVAG